MKFKIAILNYLLLKDNWVISGCPFYGGVCIKWVSTLCGGLKRVSIKPGCTVINLLTLSCKSSTVQSRYDHLALRHSVSSPQKPSAESQCHLQS